MGFVLRTVITAFGLWLATRWVDHFRIDDASTVLLAGMLLGVVNALVRPIAILLTLPITLVTLGFFLLVINAAMLGLVAWMLPGFHLGGFRAALLGAMLVGLTGWIGSWFIGARGNIEIIRKSPE